MARRSFATAGEDDSMASMKTKQNLLASDINRNTIRPQSYASTESTAKEQSGDTSADFEPVKSSCCSPICKMVSVGLFAVISIALSVTMLGFGRQIIKTIVRDMLPITSRDSYLYNVWQDNRNDDLVIMRTFYFFNLTNPYEVYNNHSIPNVRRIGPFVYYEYLTVPQETVFWTGDGRIGFNYNQDYEFVPELSLDPEVGFLSEDMNFTTINFALYAAMYRSAFFPTDGLNAFIPPLICQTLMDAVNGTILGNKGIFTTKTVSEFLFGYKDEIWESMAPTSALITYALPTICRALFNHSIPAPAPHSDRYGGTCPIWDNQSACNTTGSSLNYIYDGTTDVDLVGQFSQWAGNPKLFWWNEGGRCQDIRGSNGMTFGTDVEPGDHPFVFTDALYRSIQLDYLFSHDFSGIPVHRFGLSERDVAVSDENACYDQSYRGLFNLSRPYFGPLYASQPFFYQCPSNQSIWDMPDRQLLNFTINGTHIDDYVVDVEESRLYLDIEPIAGVLVNAHARLQVNTWMKFHNITSCKNFFPQLSPRDVWVTREDGTQELLRDDPFPVTMLPLVYLDRSAMASGNMLAQLKLGLVDSFTILIAAGAAFGALGALSLVSLAYMRNKLYAPHHKMATDATQTSPLIKT